MIYDNLLLGIWKCLYEELNNQALPPKKNKNNQALIG